MKEKRETSQSETKWTNIRILSVINQHDRVPVAWVTCCLDDRRVGGWLKGLTSQGKNKQRQRNKQTTHSTSIYVRELCVYVCVYEPADHWRMANGSASIACILTSLLWCKWARVRRLSLLFLTKCPNKRRKEKRERACTNRGHFYV